LDRLRQNWCTTFVVGLSLAIPAWFGLFSAGSPTLICPLPALTVLPAFYTPPVLLKCIVLLPTALLFTWNPGLFEADEEIPQRSYALFVGALLLNIVWFVGGWSYGLRYQGPHYVLIIGAINVLWSAALAVFILFRWKKASSFEASLFFHWILFAWLGWYAFPWLGELP